MFSKILDFMVSEKGRKALIAVSIASAAFFTLAAILVFAGVIYYQDAHPPIRLPGRLSGGT